MSTSEHERALTVVDVPSGRTCVDVLWRAIADALGGRATLAAIPEPSASTPAAVVESMRAAVRPHEPVAANVAMVVSTSGSTGRPRGVCLGVDALTCMTPHVNELAGGDPTWVLAIPPTSIGGLNVMIRAHATGRPPIAVTSLGGAGRFTDTAFAEAMTQALGTDRPVAVSLVPAQILRLLETAQGRDALASCAVVLVGGAGLSADAARDCAAAGIPVRTTYGMTETSGGCVVDGRPLPGVRVRVADDDGRISIAGPMLAYGYRDGGDEDFADGWLRTYDRGRWNEDRLEILGRLDDVVTVQGVNVDLLAVEQRLREHPLVQDAVAMVEGPDHRIHVAYLGQPIAHEEIRAWIVQTLGAPAAPATSHRVDEFAMTASGKVDRRGTATGLGLTVPLREES